MYRKALLHSDAKIAQIAARQFGVFTRPQALSVGVTRNQIEYRLAIGRWAAVHRGVYVVAGTPPSPATRRFAALVASGRHSALFGCTAATSWGFLPDDHCSEVHLAVHDRRFLRLIGVRTHRPTDLAKRDITSLGPFRVTTPIRTILDLSAHLEQDELQDALTRGVQARHIRVPALMRRVDEARGQGKKGLRALGALLDDHRHDHASGSPAEGRFLRLMRAASLPRPEREVAIVDGGGVLIGRVDFAYRYERIAIEIDGYAYHSERERWERDYERRRRLTDAGWLVLSFTVRQLQDRPDDVATSVRRALRQRSRQQRPQ
jgi:hypothetical protein